MLKRVSVRKSQTPYFIYVRHLFSNEEKKRDRRKQLWNEAKQGYFSDFHELRKNGGKIVEAPNHLLSKNETSRFAKISCKSLSGESVVLPDDSSDRVSLVLLSLRAFGMRACDEYRLHFLRNFNDNPRTAVYEISVVDQLMYRMMGRFIYRNLKHQIDVQRHRQFLYYSGKFIEEKTLLGIHNSIVGYCFLLDKNGFVRWKAHASPTLPELKSLVKCTKLLIDS